MDALQRMALDHVKAHLRAEDAQDVAGVLATFIEDCIYKIPAYNVDLRGKRQIGEFYASMFTSFPDFLNQLEIIHVAERAIFVEVTTARTHAGQWGPFAATGESFQTNSLAHFPIADGGLLGGEIVHVNPSDVLHKIGALEGSDIFESTRRLRGPLAGQAALVIGASGGIGGALAVSLAAAGGSVALAGRDESALEVAAAAVRKSGVQAETFVADVTDVGECYRLIEETVACFGHLDVLVNAAGGTQRGPALEVTEDGWDAIQSVNLKSVFFACQAAARVMKDQAGGGAIVNVASLNSVVGNAWAASYAASKGGIVQLTKSLALEWATSGIRVNAIGPGFIKTAMTSPLTTDSALSSKLLDHIPLGRFGRPDELGGAAVFLASRAASYMTGQVVYVDGGYLSV